MPAEQKNLEELRVSGRLPSPSGVGLQIMRLTQEEGHSAREIGQAILGDPALTGRLLKLANSARSGFVQPISTVSEAIIRLGIRTVRNVALGFSLVTENRHGFCAGFDYDRFWARSLARASACQALSRQTGVGVPAEMYVLGLLSGIGHLALASVHPERYAKLLSQHDSEMGTEFSRYERREFELDHTEVTSFMLQDWGLPEDFRNAVLTYERPTKSNGPRSHPIENIPELLRAATLLSDVMLARENEGAVVWNRWAVSVEKLSRRLRMEADPFHAFGAQIFVEWREWGEVLGIPTQGEPDFRRLRKRAREARKRDGVQTGQARRSHPADSEPQRNKPKQQRYELGVSLCGKFGRGILVVDGDVGDRESLSESLKSAEHVVYTADCYEAASECALRELPRIVLIDCDLPDGQGLKLLKGLRETKEGQHMYVLTTSKNKDDDIECEAFDAGANDHLTKPFNPRVLLARIQAANSVIQLQDQEEKERTEVEEAHAELTIQRRRVSRMARTDPLTGVHNRQAMMEGIGRCWNTWVRKEIPFSVILIDIDHFKVVNDENGHDVGDVVLRETAHAMRRTLREEEELCRIGGEEFLVVCPATTLEEATACAERLRETIATNVIRCKGFHGSVTLSLGVASAGRWMQTFDHLLKAADQGAYAAKDAGRNCVFIAPEGGRAIPA
jgi:two-component system cell cycle response regulator